MRNDLKVVTSSRSRFHIFDQARELDRHNMLYKIITDYPKNYVEKFGIPSDKIVSLSPYWMFSHFFTKHPSRFVSQQFIHNSFSKLLARKLPKDLNLFIGMSSFSLEALDKAKAHGGVSVIDHQGLHLEDYLDSVLEEYERHKLAPPDTETFVPRWVIEKENSEFSKTDFIFLPSKVAKLSFMRKGFPEEKLYVNHLGVDQSKFSALPKKDKVFRVLHVGRVSVAKGIFTLIKAFKKANIPNSELLIVGPLDGDEDFLNKLKKNATDNIIIHGPEPQNKLSEIYSSASVFVSASVSDGFGMVATQAMSCGIPVILSDNVGASDLLQSDGLSGWGKIFKTGDSENLTELITYYYQNPEIRESLYRRGTDPKSVTRTWHEYGENLIEFINTRTKLRSSINV